MKYYDQKIKKHADTEPGCVEIQKIEGVGPITASALVAALGDIPIINETAFFMPSLQAVGAAIQGLTI